VANGNIPYHGCHAQLMNRGCLGEGISFFSGEFELFHEFGIFLRSSAKLTKSASSMFQDPCSGTSYAIGYQMVRKKLLFCTGFFAYSLVIVVVIFSFIILLNCLYLNRLSFTFCPFSSPSHWWGKRRGE